jgi:hypothetical protein
MVQKKIRIANRGFRRIDNNERINIVNDSQDNLLNLSHIEKTHLPHMYGIPETHVLIIRHVGFISPLR